MSETKDVIGVLQRTPLLRGLNRRQLDRLARRFIDRSYQAGDAIVTQGQGGEGFFIITAGSADVMLQRGDGSEVKLNTLSVDDFFGELALLTDNLRAASVIATEPTQCIGLTRWDFIGMLKEDADMAVAILEELAKRFTQLLSTM